ncbi:hypothetical protein BD414DRAFT_501877 [Trametes punicea]|nr:hypothetical protein BD414DRAFT_501877 [Trametes punicea]
MGRGVGGRGTGPWGASERGWEGRLYTARRTDIVRMMRGRRAREGEDGLSTHTGCGMQLSGAAVRFRAEVSGPGRCAVDCGHGVAQAWEGRRVRRGVEDRLERCNSKGPRGAEDGGRGQGAQRKEEHAHPSPPIAVSAGLHGSPHGRCHGRDDCNHSNDHHSCMPTAWQISVLPQNGALRSRERWSRTLAEVGGGTRENGHHLMSRHVGRTPPVQRIGRAGIHDSLGGPV